MEWYLNGDKDIYEDAALLGDTTGDGVDANNFKRASLTMTVQPAGRGPQVMTVFLLFLALTTIATSLRVYCRAVLIKHLWGWDDALAVLAWVSLKCNICETGTDCKLIATVCVPCFLCHPRRLPRHRSACLGHTPTYRDRTRPQVVVALRATICTLQHVHQGQHSTDAATASRRRHPKDNPLCRSHSDRGLQCSIFLHLHLPVQSFTIFLD